MTTYAATVYDRPGCMRCRATERAIRKMGVPIATKRIDEDQDAIYTMAAHGWKELPLVKVEADDGEVFYWAGMSSGDLSALKWLTGVMERG